MKDLSRFCNVAIIQDSPVLFDKEACLEKALDSIYLAANNNVDLIVFPELFIPGYPYGMNFGFKIGSRNDKGRKDWKRYYDNSIVIPGKETALLAKAAKEAQSYISIGVSERDEITTTIYNTNIIFSPEGEIVNIHRKLKPTGSERVIFGDSNKWHLPVNSSPWGPMGSLICWESYMPLARVAMYEKGITIYISPNTNDNPEWFSTIKHIAIEGHCYFINANMIIRKQLYPKDLLTYDEVEYLDNMPCSGGSCIVDPYGHFVTEPVFNEESIIYAKLDMDKVIESKMEMDCCGHYSRNDVLKLKVQEDYEAEKLELSKINQDNLEIMNSSVSEDVKPFDEEDYVIGSTDFDQETLEKIRQMQQDESNANWNRELRKQEQAESIDRKILEENELYQNNEPAYNQEQDPQINDEENYIDEEANKNLENIRNLEVRLKNNPINDLDQMVQDLIRWSQEHPDGNEEEESKTQNNGDDPDYPTLEDLINKIF